MKRYIVIVLILAGILLALQVVNVHASNLRDFQSTTELEQFLELGSMTTLLPDSCKENVDQYIRASSLNGYRLERYRIASPDYYRYWLSAVFDGRELKLNEGHGVALAEVNGKDYLIEPTIPMAWELKRTEGGYAGRKVDRNWQ
jgi:hypothetical protein